MNPKFFWAALAVAVLVAALLLVWHRHLRRRSTGPLAHVENAFDFTVQAPLEQAAPLFGAWEERVWAGEDWDPQFLYPQPPEDVAGEVFTVTHGHRHSTWVNTALDFTAGHMQYVYIMAGVQAVRIDVRLRPLSETATAVHVVYERTTLDSRFNSHIVEIGKQDAENGPEWAAQINHYLQAHPPKAVPAAP
jgi:hypothetical protein